MKRTEGLGIGLYLTREILGEGERVSQNPLTGEPGDRSIPLPVKLPWIRRALMRQPFSLREKPVLPFSVCLKRLPVSETFLKHLSDMLE